jgi:hypothetical protein
MTVMIGVRRRVITMHLLHTIYTTLSLPLPPPPPASPPLLSLPFPTPTTALNVDPLLRLPLCNLSTVTHCLTLCPNCPLFIVDLPCIASSPSTPRQANESPHSPTHSHPRPPLTVIASLRSSWPRYNGGGPHSSSLSSFSSSSLSSPPPLPCCGAVPSRGR